MCVIIRREPNVVIPQEKIVSACTVNPHGLGISVIDRGKIDTKHRFYKDGNDAIELIKMMEDAKDCSIFTHLRYNTAGESNLSNCHPFQSFEGDNFEVWFMHNGTLSDFKDKDSQHSDSYLFNLNIIKPTLRAFYEVYGASVLSDPTFKTILEKFRNYNSVFTLYDNEGNHLTLGTGVDMKGWWASNDYSFNRYHREPQTYKYNNYKRTDEIWPPVNKKNDNKEEKKETKESSSDTKDECTHIGTKIQKDIKKGTSFKMLTPPSKRLTFSEMAEITSLDQVQILSEDEIFDLCNELPLAATCLIMDLLHELFQSKKEQEKKPTTLPAVVQTH